MVGLRVFEKNLPDVCRADYEKSRKEAAETALFGLTSSLANADYEALFALWVPSVHRFLDIYKFSDSELSELILALYKSLFESDLSLDGLHSTLGLLNRVLKIKRRLHLDLDWKPSFAMYENLQSTTKALLYSKAQVAGIVSELATAMRRLRKYFSPKIVQEMTEFFSKKICPGGDINNTLVYMCNLLPNKGQGECTWVGLLLDLLRTKQRNLNIVINVIACLATTSKCYPEVDWNPYLEEIYNSVLPSMPLLPQSLPRPKTYYTEIGKTAPFITKFMMRSSSFAKLVAYSLNLSNFSLLEQWLQNMRGTIKEGKMICSGYINYISRVVANYCKRIKLAHEGKFPSENKILTEALVALVKPYIQLIFFSGHLSQIDRLCTNLAYLSPNSIPFILENCYKVLEDYNMPHLDVISIFASIARPLLEPTVYPDGLNHLPMLLNTSLIEMTSADMLKACKVLEFYSIIAASINLDHSIDSVSIWAQDFFRGLLAMLSELEESSENKAEKIRGFRIAETLEYSIRALTSSVSIDIFQEWLDEFFDFIGRNNCNNAQEEFGVICKYFSMRNPEKVVGFLLKLVKNSFDKSENVLMWRVKLLTDSLLYANDTILPKISEIEKVFEKLLETEKDQKVAGELIAALLSGLVDTFPLSYSPFLPRTVETHLDLNKLRGKLSNQATDLDLEIAWRTPSGESLAAAVQLIEKYLLKVAIAKPEAKKYLKSMLPLLQTWSNFQNFSQNGPGTIEIPSGNKRLGFVNFQENIEKVVKSLEKIDGFYQDAQILELFVPFVSACICNEEYSLFEVKKAQHEANEMKRKYVNPLVPWKEKNLSESRGSLILKTHLHYKSLISAEFTQRAYTSTFDYFLHILLKLSSHQYKQIRGKSISALEIVTKSPFLNHKAVLLQVWQEIGGNLSEDIELLKIQLEILVEKGVLWRKDLANSDFSMINLLQRTHNVSDIELQTLVFNCFCNFSISCLPDCTVRAGITTVKPSRAKVEKIQSLILTSESSHWRSKLYFSIYSLLNISALNSLELLKDLKEFVAKVWLDENIDVRETGTSLGVSLLYNHLKLVSEPEEKPVVFSSFSEESRYLELENIENLNVYKVYHGWSAQTEQVKVHYHGEIDPADPLVNFFNDPAKVKQFFEFSAISHMLDSEEHIIKNPRSRNIENVNYAIKFLNNPHKFLSSLLSQNITRFAKKGKSFVNNKAKLVKLYGKAFGPQSVSVLVEVCKEYLGKDKAYQLSALEVLAGIGAASKFWHSGQVFMELLDFAVNKCTIHASSSWVHAFEFVSKNQPLSRLSNIFTVLVNVIPTAQSKKLSKVLKILSAVVEKIAWRGVKLYEKLFATLLSLSHDNFAELRSSIALLVSKILSNTSFISEKEHNSLYVSYKISQDKYLIYYKPALNYLTSISSQNSSLAGLLILNILTKSHHEGDIDAAIIPFILSAFPSIFNLLKNSDIKLVAEASEALKSLSALRITPQIYSQFFALITQTGVSESKVVEMIKGLFLTMLWFYNQFTISPSAEYFYQVLLSNSVEIKQTGKFYLSMVWKVASQQKKFEEFESAKALCKENPAFGVFRMSALVLSQHEIIENWKGEALAIMCRLKRCGGEVAVCVNNTLAEFWKHHKTWWRAYLNYSSCFTDEEIEIIESCNSDHSYFA